VAHAFSVSRSKKFRKNFIARCEKVSRESLRRFKALKTDTAATDEVRRSTAVFYNLARL